jgi:hypothetical protein
MWCAYRHRLYDSTPSYGLIMLGTDQVEYVKQFRLFLAVWRFQGQNWCNCVERRLIEKEYGPILEMLLGTIRQHQVCQEPLIRPQRLWKLVSELSTTVNIELRQKDEGAVLGIGSHIGARNDSEVSV